MIGYLNNWCNTGTYGMKIILSYLVKYVHIHYVLSNITSISSVCEWIILLICITLSIRDRSY